MTLTKQQINLIVHLHKQQRKINEIALLVNSCRNTVSKYIRISRTTTTTTTTTTSTTKTKGKAKKEMETKAKKCLHQLQQTKKRARLVITLKTILIGYVSTKCLYLAIQYLSKLTSITYFLLFNLSNFLAAS